MQVGKHCFLFVLPSSGGGGGGTAVLAVDTIVLVGDITVTTDVGVTVTT